MTPSALGTLASTPLAHALVYARNRRLTGRLELVAEDDRSANISLWRGSITAVETSPLGLCPGGFFGAVVYELGFIDAPMLDATLLELAKTKRLHGEILIERKAITPAQRDEALVEQIHRKVHHLFSLPDSTKYAFYDAKAPPIEPPVAVDLVGPVWRGVRDFPPRRFVDETMQRIGEHALRATTGGSSRLPPQESELLQALAARPMTIAEMKLATDLPAARVELLVYLLVIAKCVESVSGVRTHPSTGALPIGMPSGPVQAQRPGSGSIAAVTPGSYNTRPSSSSRVAVTSPSSSRMPVAIATPSSSRMPVARSAGSSPRIAAASHVAPARGTLAALKTPAEFGLDGLVERAQTVEEEGFFEVLGVADGASEEAVRAAFVRLAKTWHPDKLVADFNPVRTEVATIFTYMTRAHRTLTDPEARRAYVARRESRNASRPRADVVREIERAFELRNFENVMTLCDELTRKDPDDAGALALHAWATVRAGEASEDELRVALVKLDRAVNLDRTSEEAVYHRGLVHKRLGNAQAAFRDFARTVQLSPKHIGAEREVRLYAMRVKKGSGEHKLALPILEKLDLQVRKK